jgi:hypothetical protein
LAAHRDAHDLTAGRGELGDLLQGGADIGDAGGGHGQDGCAAVDSHGADHDLAGYSAR